MRPTEASKRFAETLSAGDLEGALACWTEDAVIVAADGSSAEGQSALRNRFEQLMAAGAQIQIEVRDELVAGDVAVASTTMELRVGDAPVRASGAVVYRLIDGRWRIAIDRVRVPA